jgi:AmmeMemoRadiSam system protein B/AmmeMemoRadiSam system protein A
MIAQIIIYLFFVVGLTLGSGCAQNIKEAEFAGSFYPGDKNELSSVIDGFFNDAKEVSLKGKLLGVISPHAGYIYSGSVAAYSYKNIKNEKIKTVILLGSSHRYGFRGVSIYPQGAFESPLGVLKVDAKLAKEFSSLEFVQYEEKYFSGEHSLEVQIPFIIKALGRRVKIVPVLFGEVNYQDLEQIGEKLSQISGKGKTLIIVSTDLSHYLPYSEAVEVDQQTISLVESKDVSSLWLSWTKDEGRACGLCPLISFLICSRIEGANIKILKYANSGDTVGDKSRVVGYFSAIAYKTENQKSNNENKGVGKLKEADMGGWSLTDDEKISLLKIARTTLESYLKDGKQPSVKADTDKLKENKGVFVTLKKQGQLRGCIGRLVADTPLYRVVSDFAIHAAVEDPRFKPVTYEELADIEIEISVITPFEKVISLDEIEVGKHGLMIEKGFNSGLLLPQVPLEYNWDKETFLQHTCLKAGLAPLAYKDKDAILYKFSAIVFNEAELIK